MAVMWSWGWGHPLPSFGGITASPGFSFHKDKQKASLYGRRSWESSRGKTSFLVPGGLAGQLGLGPDEAGLVRLICRCLCHGFPVHPNRCLPFQLTLLWERVGEGVHC